MSRLMEGVIITVISVFGTVLCLLTGDEVV